MIRPLTCLTIAALLAGCGASRLDYPSLAPRAVERGGALPVSAPVPIVADRQLDAEAARIVAEAEAADARFAKEARAARTAVGRAGRVGGERWLDAQQALTALQAARGTLAGLVDDLDVLRFDAVQRPARVDTARLSAAAARIAAIDAAQATTLAAIEATLPAR